MISRGYACVAQAKRVAVYGLGPPLLVLGPVPDKGGRELRGRGLMFHRMGRLEGVHRLEQVVKTVQRIAAKNSHMSHTWGVCSDIINAMIAPFEDGEMLLEARPLGGILGEGAASCAKAY
jgi:hypothetical protein